METERLEVSNIPFMLKIHYEQRKNCSISIRKNNINIRIPRSLSSKQQAIQLEKMKQMARTMVLKNPSKFKPSLQKEYRDGDEIKINGTSYYLNITYKDNKHSSAKMHGQMISLCIANTISKEKQQSHVSSLLSRCIGSERLPLLKQKIHELNENFFKQQVNHIFFKYNTSNWGSCSKAGNINISTRLLFAPDDVLEYVCIHELAHLIELNHSDQFWQLVQGAMPDYKRKIQWLKENAEQCKF